MWNLDMGYCRGRFLAVPGFFFIKIRKKIKKILKKNPEYSRMYIEKVCVL